MCLRSHSSHKRLHSALDGWHDVRSPAGVSVRQRRLMPDDDRLRATGCPGLADKSSSAVLLSFTCKVIVPERAAESQLHVTGPPEVCSSDGPVTISEPGQHLVPYEVRSVHLILLSFASGSSV